MLDDVRDKSWDSPHETATSRVTQKMRYIKSIIERHSMTQSSSSSLLPSGVPETKRPSSEQNSNRQYCFHSVRSSSPKRNSSGRRKMNKNAITQSNSDVMYKSLPKYRPRIRLSYIDDDTPYTYEGYNEDLKWEENNQKASMPQSESAVKSRSNRADQSGTRNCESDQKTLPVDRLYENLQPQHISKINVPMSDKDVRQYFRIRQEDPNPRQLRPHSEYSKAQPRAQLNYSISQPIPFPRNNTHDTQDAQMHISQTQTIEQQYDDRVHEHIEFVLSHLEMLEANRIQKDLKNFQSARRRLILDTTNIDECDSINRVRSVHESDTLLEGQD